MTDAVIDKATFEALEQSTGADFAKELVDTFLAEAPEMLKALRQAFADKNVELFRRTAHSLKSNSNTFGAMKLGTMARDLELGAPDAVKASSPTALDALDAEYARVSAALKVLRNA